MRAVAAWISVKRKVTIPEGRSDIVRLRENALDSAVCRWPIVTPLCWRRPQENRVWQ
jgi:hypothetical protein